MLPLFVSAGVMVVFLADERSWKVVAIIDIDCAVEAGFDSEDQKCLEQLAELLSKSCDW